MRDIDRYEEIKLDLTKREMEICGVIAVDQNGELQVITYGEKGQTTCISEKTPVVCMYSRNFEEAAMRAIGDLYTPKAQQMYLEKKHARLQKEMQEEKSKPKELPKKGFWSKFLKR